MINDKKVLYSGMQATGNLTLGNYLGALKNWVSLNEEYECFFWCNGFTFNNCTPGTG